MKLFENRRQAATELADKLSFLREERPIVLGLANGGIPIADVVARSLEAPLDVLLFERLAAPKSPDHIVGVVDEHGRISMIESTARWHHLTSRQMIQPAREVFRDLQRRRGRFRGVLPELDVRSQTVIIVGQGIATGGKMLGAIASVRDRGATKVVATAPAGHSRATWQLHDKADLVVIPHQPSQFKGIEDLYENYSEVTDDIAIGILERWVASRTQPAPGVRTLALKLHSTRGHLLSCEIDLPPGTDRGSGPFPAVVFAHGFESTARSQRSVPISQRLAKRGIIGVRFDFTSHGRSEGSQEDATDRQMIEDLHVVFQSVAQLAEVDEGQIGVNGAGTGGMIALHYAAQQPLVKTLVIRGPICGKEVAAARKVTIPTLLIHAEHDLDLQEPVEAINRSLAGSHELLVIPDSNRLFGDPISRELMIGATVDWFADHLRTDYVSASGPAASAASASGPTQSGDPERAAGTSETS